MDIWHRRDPEIQGDGATSFVGGQPLLPSGFDVPKIPETGEDMTFFFQLDMSSIGKWSGKIFSLFAATSYFDENRAIPEMLSGPLRGVSIPHGFLDKYQHHFRVYFFDVNAVARSRTYKPLVSYNELHFGVREGGRDTLFGYSANGPLWYLDDETPGDYDGYAPTFLFQTRREYQYRTEPGAPRQKVPDYINGGLTDSLVSQYDLFNANEVYYFGFEAEQKVYILTQI